MRRSASTTRAAGSRRPITVSVALLALVACTHRPAQQPAEYLDSVTAASVSSVSTPIVFARAHQDVAANSRQYATVVGASVNRSGHYEYLLLVYIWSTVDPRLGAGIHPGDTLVVLADDRAIRLQRDGRSLREAGIAKRLSAPLHARGGPRIYRIDQTTMLFIAGAHRLRMQLEGDGDTRPFDVWEDGRRALEQLASAAIPDNGRRPGPAGRELERRIN